MAYPGVGVNRPVRSDEALAIAAGLTVAAFLERRDRLQLAADSVLFHTDRDRAALAASRPVAVPTRSPIGVAITASTSIALMVGGVALACSTAVIDGRTILGSLLILAGGMLVRRLVQVTR